MSHMNFLFVCGMTLFVCGMNVSHDELKVMSHLNE